ncbi:MAG: CsgG/HfaB family protein [Planctomycetales bacterium]|nr:CsgG/HfaB family protein [Planctomycetales bacterium]
MKTLQTVLLGLAAVSFLGCTSGKSYHHTSFDFSKIDKIAVVDVIGPVGSEAAKNQIADFFMMELLQKGYSPIERAQVQILLNEQKFQASDITSSEGAVQAGRILNVPVIMYINVPKFGDNIFITAKMVDVEDGSILWMGEGKGSGGKLLGTVLGAAAGAIVGGAVSGDEDRVLGAVGGGAAGGAAGYLLTPQTEEKVRKMTEKICKTMPVRQPAPVSR